MIQIIPGRPLTGRRRKRQLFSDVAGRLQRTAGLSPRSSQVHQLHRGRDSHVSSSTATLPVIISSATISTKQTYADAPLSDVDNVHCRSHPLVRLLTPATERGEDTELTCFGKPSPLASLTSMDRSVTVGSSIISPRRAVSDLRDGELAMKPQIASVTSSYFYQLHRLKHVRHSAGQELTTQLVHAFVLSRHDYGNSAMAGLPKSTILPL